MSPQKNLLYEFHQDSLFFTNADKLICFCKKPAHLSYSLKCGVVLKCANYDMTVNGVYCQYLKNKFVCGYHVHEPSWRKIRQDFSRNQTVDAEHPEVISCPAYNFTYCSVFYLTNTYDKLPPLELPKCHCKQPAIFREVYQTYAEHRLCFYFTCRNSAIEGTEKCSWRLEAKEARFPKPKKIIYNRVNKKNIEEQLDSHQPDHTKRHQINLLATLTASKTEDASKSAQKTSLTNVDSSKMLQPLTLAPYPRSMTFDTSLLANPRMEEVNWEDLEKENAYLKEELSQIKNECQIALEERECLWDALQEVTMQLENCQNALSHCQITIANLMTADEQLKEEYSNFRQDIQRAYGKEDDQNKCKVCFQSVMEYILIPCFHYAYCRPCAFKLKECAICREEVFEIRKVFTC